MSFVIGLNWLSLQRDYKGSREPSMSTSNVASDAPCHRPPGATGLGDSTQAETTASIEGLAREIILTFT